MYKPLNLYYLQQLGIRPWIRRDLPLIAPSLVVITPSFLSEKARQLLSQILECLPKENVVVFSKDTLSTQDMPSLVSAILLFDLKFSELNFTVPVFKAEDLEDLLINPVLKKEVFKTLQQLVPLFSP